MGLRCAFVQGRAGGLVFYNNGALLEIAHWKDARLTLVGYPIALQTGQSLCYLDLTALLNRESFTNELAG